MATSRLRLLAAFITLPWILTGCAGPKPIVMSFTAVDQTPLPISSVLAASTMVTDPPYCPTAENPDLGEVSLGGLTSKSPLSFAAGVSTQDLYSRISVTMKLCTDRTLSSADRKTFEKVLNTLNITKAATFASSLSVTFGTSGARYPSIVPFSYTFDESSNQWSVDSSDDINLPWQTTNNGYSLSITYYANKNTSVNAAKLVGDIITTLEGADLSTSLISLATKKYIDIGSSIIDQITNKALSDKNTAKHNASIDIATNNNRGLIFRLRDTKNRPLAAFKVAVILTNTLTNPKPLVPTTENVIPHLTNYPDILGITLAGPLSGTLGDAIAKEASYKAIIGADSGTNSTVFSEACDNLQNVLRNIYGLNKYDEALVMGEILYKTPSYFNNQNLSGSHCFRNPASTNTNTLVAMGLKFENP